MEKLGEIRGRIKGVAGIRQVCRTLATVSSAKLSKARDQALGLRVYTARLRGVVERQQSAAAAAGEDPSTVSPLLAEHAVERVLVFAIGGDRGLCGGYNLAISRAAREFAEARTAAGVEVVFAVLGGKVERYLRRLGAYEIGRIWNWSRRGVTEDLLAEVNQLVSVAFLQNEADEVWCAYTEFISPVQREPRVVRLLPIVADAGGSVGSGSAGQSDSWFYEPERLPVVREAVERLALAQVEDVVLESFASEHAARMVTMEEASERADRMLAELRVRANRVRRESVTADLLGVLVSRRVGRAAGSYGAKL